MLGFREAKMDGHLYVTGAGLDYFFIANDLQLATKHWVPLMCICVWPDLLLYTIIGQYSASYNFVGSNFVIRQFCDQDQSPSP